MKKSGSTEGQSASELIDKRNEDHFSESERFRDGAARGVRPTLSDQQIESLRAPGAEVDLMAGPAPTVS